MLFVNTVNIYKYYFEAWTNNELKPVMDISITTVITSCESQVSRQHKKTTLMFISEKLQLNSHTDDFFLQSKAAVV